MLPLAYAFVEVENKETWTWVLEWLIEYIGGTTLCSTCNCILDQQKVWPIIYLFFLIPFMCVLLYVKLDVVIIFLPIHGLLLAIQ